MNMDMAGLAGMMMGLQGGAGMAGAEWMQFAANPMAAAAPVAAAQPQDFESQLKKFVETYPMDERALEFLIQTPADVRQKVIENFDPKNKAETDYSRQVTSYIRSQQNRKRTREEEENPFAAFDKRPNTGDAPSEEDLNMFRLKYPMDDRAWEFLCTSPSAAVHQVLSEFRPRTEGEADYSSLVTSMVKRARQACGAEIPTSAAAQYLTGAMSQGPSPEQLQEFRRRYPMDERAWDYLSGVPGPVQQAVLVEFRPKREGDSDYSAPVTAFVRAKSSRLGIHPPSSGLPSGLSSAGAGGCGGGGGGNQSDLAALTQLLESPGVGELLQNGGISQLLQVVAQADAAWEENNVQPMRGGGNSQMAARLQAFRAQYPMDDRAFDFLSQEDPAVQDAFLSQFRPKREGEGDYSGAVTSYLRNVKTRMPAYGGGGKPAAATPSFGGGAGDIGALLAALNGNGGGGGGGCGGGPLEAFRARYPMDERAFEFLQNADPSVQEAVLAEFSPKREGEADYSGAVTSYIRTVMRRILAGGSASAAGTGVGLSQNFGAGGGMNDSSFNVLAQEMARAAQSMKGSSGGSPALQAFRARYPMDDRAWDYLTQQDQAVQDIVLSEFSPKREGDSNYSGAVTSYVKTALRKVSAGSAAGGGAAGMASAMGGGMMGGGMNLAGMANALGGMGNAGGMAGLLGW